MARLESQAVAGFFPTPARVIPLISALFKRPDRTWSLCDPCAGEGAAAISIADGECVAFVAELEHERFEALKRDRRLSNHALFGDAFRIAWAEAFVSLLYLNPPYDVDPQFVRLEARWLDRWADALLEGGRLAFVVPYYGLEASARTLALKFDQLECFAFPDPEFSEYKQVVLVARRCPDRLEPSSEILAAVARWATGEGFSTFRAGARLGKRELPECGYLGQEPWRKVRFDAIGLLAKARPWRRSTTSGGLEPVPGVMPLVPVADLMETRFPVATPPRAAHMAAGIASGLFNGRRVSSPGKPDLLVKGVFSREYVGVQDRENEDGEVIGRVEVQIPRLVITTLDLTTGAYCVLKPESAAKLGEPTIEALLADYGPSLRGVMSERCPVVFDPERPDPRLEMGKIARPLYPAQDAAARAVYGLLAGVDEPGTEPRDSVSVRESARRGGRTAILLGEIGVGKTSVALAVANTIARTPLVVCPPHLLDGWRDQTAAVTPWAEVRVLREPADVDALAAEIAADPMRLRVAVLSREAAKLGHGRAGVEGGVCPRCGLELHERPDDLARRRVRCPRHTRRAVDALARAAVDLAIALAPSLPKNERVGVLLQGRHQRRWLKALAVEGRKPAPWLGVPRALIDRCMSALLVSKSEEQRAPAPAGHHAALNLVLLLALELNDPAGYGLAADLLTRGEHRPYEAGETAKLLVSLMPPGAMRDELAELAFGKPTIYSTTLEDYLRRLDDGNGIYTRLGYLRRDPDFGLVLGSGENAILPGSAEAASTLLTMITQFGVFDDGEACGEPLYQATPDPRRYPVANYIVRRYPKLFDMLVLDEAHELQGFTQSAQGIATARLSGLRLPTIRMTGSMMNGYAESCFGTMWLSDPWFRADFGRREVQRFIDIYGYRKRLLSDRDKETGEIVEFGSVSDRIVRSERIIGDAPGILPLFLFRYLLRRSVTLQKQDLGAHIPPCKHIVSFIEAGPELRAEYVRIVGRVVEQIKKDRFDETGKAGALFGALAQIGTYLDRSTEDTGNEAGVCWDTGDQKVIGHNAYVVRYPAKLGGDVVAMATPFPAGRISAKERWLIDTLKQELAEGRNAMVFLWNDNLFPRIKRGLEAKLKVEVPMLLADKVPTAKRQSWIDREVVRKGARVLLVNPVCVQTGLNNLVHFSTEIFYQDPACNPTATRQAIGRIDRLGQRKPTRVYFPVYAHTVQKATHELLLRKIAVATAADGLDPESVLLAAGGADDGFLAGMSLGRQLYEMIERDEATLGAAPSAMELSA